MRTVLACLDFSDTSIPVMDEAARLADVLGARVVLLHVEPFEPDYVGFDMGYASSAATATLPVEKRPGYLELQKRAARLAAPDRVVETVYDQGLVVDRIIEQAKKSAADIVVVGSHGHGALYHLLMGSVTEGVLRRIGRPVLVVPKPSDA